MPNLGSRLSRRAAAAFSALALALALTATTLSGPALGVEPDDLELTPVQPRLTTELSGDKAPSSALARTPRGLRDLTSPKRIPVMIKLDFDPLASYTGTVPGLEATSPSITGRDLGTRRAAERRYLSHVQQQERAIRSDIAEHVPAATISRSFHIVYGGIAAVVPGNRIRDLLTVPGVVAVQRDALRQPLTDSSTEFIEADAAYEALGTTANAGEGILLGNLDTGVWPEHPSLADQGNLKPPPGPALTCDFGDNPLTLANDPFVCQNKLVGGAAFVDTYHAVIGDDYLYSDSARDSDGHGSHTSTTSAGNVVEHVETLGPVLERINGVAPGAPVMEYRVCAPAGCFSSDSTAAVEQAILDGVRVINFSISGGTEPFADPVELAFLGAYDAGVFVAASAGNDGPGASTANHLSPWVTTVAASTQTREFATTLQLAAGDGATFEVDGASITAGAGPLPVVSASAAPYSDVLCTTPAPPGTFAGKIVACRRGAIARADKGFNVLQGGAAGMILYNPTLADIETDNHWLPTVHVADGTDLVAFLGGHSDITGEFAAGEQRDGEGDVMAAFSSRGPAGPFIKPDITAPGVQILAAHTPTPEFSVGGPPGEYYQAIAGTSMSSPHIAGVALLLAGLHPDWTPGQIKSAIMTQATHEVVKEDTVTPADPFDMGSGRVVVSQAMRAPLTISEEGVDFLSWGGDPVSAVHLNLPSINAPVMPGRVVTVRTLTNVTPRPLLVRPRASVPDKTRIDFDRRTYLIEPGQSRDVEITLRSWAPAGEQQFAEIVFATRKGTATVPVAFVPRQGGVTLTQACDVASVPMHHTADCTVTATNTAFETQDVELTTSTSRRLRIVGADGATVSGGEARASATLAGATPGVPSVDPGSSPAGGYLPLEAFGVTPEPIGDEEFLVFDTPPYVYNGQPYTQLSVNSNGYAVAGVATAEDNNCCNLPPGPSPDRPNNMLAPFWTDLDGTGAEGIYPGVLTDGVNTWLVIQWVVDVFGTTDTRSFQTWIGVDGAQDISFTYEAAQADPNGQDVLVGAENVVGGGDVASFLPEEDLVVTSSDPAPGDSLAYTVTVRGRAPGPAWVKTEMVADRVPGVTTVVTKLPVTRR